jgi:hypothetical protein
MSQNARVQSKPPDMHCGRAGWAVKFTEVMACLPTELGIPVTYLCCVLGSEYNTRANVFVPAFKHLDQSSLCCIEDVNLAAVVACGQQLSVTTERYLQSRKRAGSHSAVHVYDQNSQDTTMEYNKRA